MSPSQSIFRRAHEARSTHLKNGNSCGHPAVSKFAVAPAPSTCVGSISSNLIILRIEAKRIRINFWKRGFLFFTLLWANRSNGMCPSISMSAIRAISVVEKLKSSSVNSRDTREVKNFAAALTPLNSLLQPYGTAYVFIQFWNQISVSTWYFNPNFSIHQRSSTMSSACQQPHALLSVIPTAGYIFFWKRLNRGFYIPVLLPVHRGVLSVVTLNASALVPIGEYNISPTFHIGRTHRGPFDSLCWRWID